MTDEQFFTDHPDRRARIRKPYLEFVANNVNPKPNPEEEIKRLSNNWFLYHLPLDIPVWNI